MLQLHIGNKNYSSWSMRPWVLLRHFGLPFEEVMHRFDSFDAGSRFKQAVTQLSPVGKVPVLAHGDLVVWDTLAIAEYVAEYAAEHFPEQALWPRDQTARARARSLCAEMHSGFGALRSACPMNIEASLPDVGARVLAKPPWPPVAGPSCSAASASPMPTTPRWWRACAPMPCPCPPMWRLTCSGCGPARVWPPGWMARWQNRSFWTSRNLTARGGESPLPLG